MKGSYPGSMISEYWRLLRFLGVGLLNTGFGYFAYTVFVLANAPLWLAVGSATLLAFLFNFVTYGGFVFGSTSHVLLPRFLLFYLSLGTLNFALLRLSAEARLGPLLAQAILLPVLAAAGYLGMRFYVFRDLGSKKSYKDGMNETPFEEEFKPIPIRREHGLAGHAFFNLRMVADLQLLTCKRFVAPLLANMRGAVLDVGCGEKPFREFLGRDASYMGLDIVQADAFGMRRYADIVLFDGREIPFPEASFDHVLCSEVLEHAGDPVTLIAEIHRVLRPGGTLVATIPFAARVHHAPHDFHRFTRFQLAVLFANFAKVDISERGDDLAVVANKLIVICTRLSRLRPLWRLPVRLAVLIVLTPISLAALATAHLSLLFGWGSRADPLGYGIVARKGLT